MGGYSLIDGHYLLPTPAGAYAAVAYPRVDSVRRLLCSLLSLETTPLLIQEALERWTGLEGEEAQESLYHAQNHLWVEGFKAPRNTPAGALEDLLPALLPPLSESGKALLADTQGSCLAEVGFTHEAAMKLSALNADIASLDTRHGEFMHRDLRLDSAAWSLVDAAGNSQLGFWPLFIGEQRFTLVLQGVPHFNQPAFTELAWTLSTRYAQPERE